MSNQKLPREGTAARAVVDALKSGDISYSDAQEIYLHQADKNGRHPSRRHTGLTITRLLKKYGHKLGKSGTRANWRFGAFSDQFETTGLPVLPPLKDALKVYDFRLYKVGDKVRLISGPAWVREKLGTEIGTIDERLETESKYKLWGPEARGFSIDPPGGGYWPVSIENPLYGDVPVRFAEYGANLELVQEEKPTEQSAFAKASDELEDLQVGGPSVDSLVKYAVPGQDEGMLGRVLETDDGMRRAKVMWANTSETEWVCWENLIVYRDSISKRALGKTVRVSPFTKGQRVVYLGPMSQFAGAKGTVTAIFPTGRVGVDWGKLGPSKEDAGDIGADQSEILSDLAVGTNVSCKKHGLTFPAKVFLGPMSNGDYKVVCPNGTFEWVTRDMMTVIEGAPYQATVEKPTYGQPAELPLSARSLRLKDMLDRARAEAQNVQRLILDLEDQLRESVALDREEDWARTCIGTFSDRQRQAMLNVLKGE